VDAAIIFSDILVIPEAMGLNYGMVEKKGPLFDQTIESVSDIKKLASGKSAAESLDYVFEAIQITKKELDDRVPLIGFSGAPWTLMAYMIEGQGSKTFSKAKKFLYQHPKESEVLLDSITDTIIEYLKLKIKAGVNAIQIFDSWASMLSPDIYNRFMIKQLDRICKEITEVPIILFSKGAWFALGEMKNLDCQGIGLDWNTKPSYAKDIVGHSKVFQGNADPCLLYADEAEIRLKTREMLAKFGSKHIANLGHGVYPDTPLSGVKTFVNTVKEYKYS